MARQGRKQVCLLVDNASSHLKFNQADYPNVEVIFFHPNMTSHIQPADASIIKGFKALYKKDFILQALQRDEDGYTGNDIYGINQLEAMYMILNACQNYVMPHTVQNCWRHTSILQVPDMQPPEFHPIHPIPIDPTLQTPGQAQESNDVVVAVAELDAALKRLAVDHVTKKDVMSADELLEVAGEKITEGEWTDQDIVDQIRIDQCESNGEDVPELDAEPLEPISPISITDANEAIKQLEKLFQTRPDRDFHDAQVLL